MYDWWLATEQAELRQAEAARRGDVYRQRAEAIEEWERRRPSLLRRIVAILTPAADEPLMARSPVEAEVLGRLMVEEDVRGRAA